MSPRTARRPRRFPTKKELEKPDGGLPDAVVKQIHNDTEVTLPSLREDVEIAAFGRPGKDDRKRMQMTIFASRPTQGRDWKIWVYLVDDTNPACKVSSNTLFL